jgi:hypothetical protein
MAGKRSAAGLRKTTVIPGGMTWNIARLLTEFAALVWFTSD